MHLDERQPTGHEIRNIPFYKFIPRIDEQAGLRSDMIVMIERICVSHLPYFEDLAEDIVWSIQHEHSTELSKKSSIVCLFLSQIFYPIQLLLSVNFTILTSIFIGTSWCAR